MIRSQALPCPTVLVCSQMCTSIKHELQGCGRLVVKYRTFLYTAQFPSPSPSLPPSFFLPSSLSFPIGVLSIVQLVHLGLERMQKLWPDPAGVFLCVFKVPSVQLLYYFIFFFRRLLTIVSASSSPSLPSRTFSQTRLSLLTSRLEGRMLVGSSLSCLQTHAR